MDLILLQNELISLLSGQLPFHYEYQIKFSKFSHVPNAVTTIYSTDSSYILKYSNTS